MMKIRRLVIDNFKGIDHLEMGELPDSGVFVISGDNEEGKSTIMEALDFIFTEVKSKEPKKVKKAQTIGQDLGPCVTVELEAGDYELRMKRRWLKKAESVLTVTRPAPETLKGEAANERFLEILEDNIDVDLARVLFLKQNVLEPQLAAAGIPSLAAALNDQTGMNDSGGSVLGTALVDAVDEEYDRYWGKNENPVQDLKKAQKKSEETEKRLGEARAVARKLAGYIDDVNKAEATEREAESALPAARSAVAEREAEYTKAQEATQRRDASVKAVNEAQARLHRAEERLGDRAELKEDVKRRQAARDRLHEELSEAEEKARTETEKIAELSQRLATVREQEEAAREALKKARQSAKQAEQRVRLAELDTRLARIQKRRTAVNRATEALPRVLLDAEDYDTITAAREELRVARALAEASQAKLHLRGPVGQEVLVDDHAVVWQTGEQEDSDAGRPSSGSAEVTLADGTRITIGDVEATFAKGTVAADGDATVAGEGSGDGALRAPTDRAAERQREYQELLDRFGVQDIEQARELAQATASATSELEEARRELSATLDGDEEDALRAERDRLVAELGAPDGTQEGGEEDDDVAAEPTDLAQARAELAQARSALDDAEERHDAAQRERASADKEIEPWQEKPAARELIGVQTRYDGATEELEAATKQLERVEDEAPVADLEAEVAAARAHHTQQTQKLSADQKALDEVNPEEAEDRFEGAKQKVRSLEERAQKAHDIIHEMRGRVDQAQGAEEEAAQIEDELEKARFQRDSIQRQADAAMVLSKALHRHRDEARRRYADPFAQALQKLSATVFGPETSFEFDDELKVISRNDGRGAIDVELLSGGAQEQLMILSRLAVAQLVGSETGELTAPVFIDDALGNTDAERLERMGVLLSKLGASGQIFVLTCVPSRYDSVRNKVELPMASLKATDD